jgi:hypothetical protein
MRQRLALIAARIAISLRRPVARANKDWRCWRRQSTARKPRAEQNPGVRFSVADQLLHQGSIRMLFRI